MREHLKKAYFYDTNEESLVAGTKSHHKGVI